MSSLKSKLQIKEDMVGGVLNCPKTVSLGLPTLNGFSAVSLDYSVVFVSTAKEIAFHARKAAKALREDGVLWFAYPKKSGAIATDISRDAGWTPLTSLGYRPVRQIAIDATWSALRFRKTEYVKR
jgi:hypothetical protein